MMIEENDYQLLLRDQKKHLKWFQFSGLGLSVCLIAALIGGPIGGWPWICGAILFATTALSQQIAANNVNMLAAIYEEMSRKNGQRLQGE